MVSWVCWVSDTGATGGSGKGFESSVLDSFFFLPKSVRMPKVTGTAVAAAGIR